MDINLKNCVKKTLKLNKIFILAIILISSCKKDRYVLSHEVTIESDSKVSGGGFSCQIVKQKVLKKKGETVVINFQSCGKGCRIKVYAGKKVYYDETKYSHSQAITI